MVLDCFCSSVFNSRFPLNLRPALFSVLINVGNGSGSSTRDRNLQARECVTVVVNLGLSLYKIVH